MGIGNSMGLDMVESENVPTLIDLKDQNEEVKLAKTFAVGQRTQIMQDTDNNVYMTGLKLNYTPKMITFDKEILDVNDVSQIACGKRGYII